jgi:hypothetical protein
MKFKTTLTVRQILDYLKGKLSNRERHVVEKKLMNDVFEEEAFEGLSSIPPEEFQKDINLLQQKIRERTNNKNRKIIFTVFKVAASIIVLIGLVITVRISFKNKVEIPASNQIAEKKEMQVTDKQEMAAPEAIISQKEVTKPLNQGGQLAYEDLKTERKVEVRSETIIQNEEVLSEPAAEYTESAEMNAKAKEIPAVSSDEKRMTVDKKAKAASGKLIKGKVTDQQGQPLIGATVMEKGTTNAVVTNINGEFELILPDTGNMLAFNNLGYISEELPADEIKNGKVEMAEDVVALDEVVVVGYGVQKKSDLTGAVASVKAEEIEKSTENETIQAKPPTGNFISFKKYIYKKLDYSKFNDLLEKQKIVVEFMVYRNGAVGDFQFKQPADERICIEIERVIKESGKWQTSTQNDQPVDSKVKIRLLVDPGAKGQ